MAPIDSHVVEQVEEAELKNKKQEEDSGADASTLLNTPLNLLT